MVIAGIICFIAGFILGVMKDEISFQLRKIKNNIEYKLGRF